MRRPGSSRITRSIRDKLTHVISTNLKSSHPLPMVLKVGENVDGTHDLHVLERHDRQLSHRAECRADHHIGHRTRCGPQIQLDALAGILRRASAKYGSTIYLVSDEPYRRIVYDGSGLAKDRMTHPGDFQ